MTMRGRRPDETGDDAPAAHADASPPLPRAFCPAYPTLDSVRECQMKKKSARGIPDFSQKRTASKTPQAPEVNGGPRSTQPKNLPKPHATSAKSGGRRGT